MNSKPRLLLQRHTAFYAGLGCAVIAGFCALFFTPALAASCAANVFFVVYLILSLLRMRRMSAHYLKNHAASTDEPVWIIFAVTLVAIIIAVAALFILINQKPAADLFSLSVTLLAVPLGWLTIHMMAATHYAHLYWQPDPAVMETSSGKAHQSGGLAFPGTAEPCGSDFMYFAYVIGMTAQTSDTNITTSPMRRVNLLHAIVSFFFNTVLVAAAVNIAVALGS